MAKRVKNLADGAHSSRARQPSVGLPGPAATLGLNHLALDHLRIRDHLRLLRNHVGDILALGDLVDLLNHLA